MVDTTQELVENFFRHESANLTAVLGNFFGFALIDVVEDMVQEAMLEALRNWRINGIPENPAGWLHRVARNRIIDTLRRDRRSVGDLEQDSVEVFDQQCSFESEALEDSLLRMIFVCSHPTLDETSRLALTLKVLCGLGDQEISRGLLKSPSAIKKRISRAKRHLQLNRISLELPQQKDLTSRLTSVHHVLYLMFNEGYSASRGDLPMRIDLCEEAARLCHLICGTQFATAETHALMALMLFHAARFDSRLDESGCAILLADQDRSQWDRNMINVADYWLAKSASRDRITAYHLQAAIARIHCHSDSIESTDWQAIVQLYDQLLRINHSPICRLNRAVAIGQTGQTTESLALLSELAADEILNDYPLLYCALAELSGKMGQIESAAKFWKHAKEMVNSAHEKSLIDQKLEAVLRSGQG